MVDKAEIEPVSTGNRTTVERKSDREIVVTRTFDAPAQLVYEAWTQPELLKQWWVPKSLGMTLISVDADVRPGGKYRLVFEYEGSTMDFFGKYLEVVPASRLSWTNDEGGDEGSVTAVTFEETNGTTLLVMTETYPSKEALEAAGGAADATHETFAQLDELLVSLAASQ